MAEEKPVSQYEELASFFDRGLAYVIDFIPFVAFSYVSLKWYAGSNWTAISYPFAFRWLVLWLLLYALYASFFTHNGFVTLGKYIAGIRVRDVSGSAPTFAQSFGRVLGFFLSTVFIYIGFVPALFGMRRTLHDVLAGTYVARVRPPTAVSSIISAVITLAAAGFIAFSFVSNAAYKFKPGNMRAVYIARMELVKLAEYQAEHKKKYGFYTDNLNRLAQISGDPVLFQKRLQYALSPGGLIVSANKEGYYFSAFARDPRKTAVELSGK